MIFEDHDQEGTKQSQTESVEPTHKTCECEHALLRRSLQTIKKHALPIFIMLNQIHLKPNKIAHKTIIYDRHKDQHTYTLAYTNDIYMQTH